jgi:hypothetical protein
MTDVIAQADLGDPEVIINLSSNELISLTVL